MNSFNNTTFGSDSAREILSENTKVDDINFEMKGRSNSINLKQHKATDNIVHSAFPHKQKIVEDIKPTIKISKLSLLSTNKIKTEVYYFFDN
jgi:hypothetical protein